MTVPAQTTINARVQLLIDELKLTNNAFSRQVGVAASVIGNITGGRKGAPSFELLEKIGAAYPELSMDWLVRGEGFMFRSESECARQLAIAQKKYSDLEQDFEALLTSYKRLKRLNALLDRPTDGDQTE